jgi:hypothetical protein
LTYVKYQFTLALIEERQKIMQYLFDILYILGIGWLLMIGIMASVACIAAVLAVAMTFLMK